MADTPDFRLPFNDLTNLVPKHLRNEVIESLIDNLFNRFMTRDESIPLFGFIGRGASTTDTNADSRIARIAEPTVERDINSIVPVLSFKLGTETIAFTVQDIIRKANALGVSTNGLQWLYSQGNNYVPPINLDKFTNFFNYYWVAKSVETVPNMPWNPELLPEYYTISKPAPTDLNKLNVVAATTRPIKLTGSGFDRMKFLVTFVSPTSFTITPQGSLGSYSGFTGYYNLTTNDEHFDYIVAPSAVQDVNEPLITLFSFNVTREEQFDQNGVLIGTSGFEIGDRFSIDLTFLSRNYTVTFLGGTGVKGKITKVRAYNEFQKIDGVALQPGDRVLVKNNIPGETGIYVVSRGIWERAEDFNSATQVAGARTYVQGGVTNANKIFKSSAVTGGFAWTAEPTVGQSNTNDWQEGNYWIRGDQLGAIGLDRSQAVQAVRPIIEYDAAVQMNSFIKNGAPADSGDAYRQTKSEFNQIPLFDLYRYDGTHSGLVSSVFFYEEDLTARLDTHLQKRVKKSNNSSADFIFNHGMADADGQLLFIKYNTDLKTIWRAGYTAPLITDVTVVGKGNGTVDALMFKDDFVQQQILTLRALSPTQFSVESSKIKELPLSLQTANLEELYETDEYELVIRQGSIPWVKDDVVYVRIGNIESPRYVSRNGAGAIYDRYGKEALDPAGQGTRLLPRTFSNNPYNESQSPLAEGLLYSHFRSILGNQIPNGAMNYAFGGNIKLWSEQHTLLASLLMQRDLTPISMIDLAQRQYETGLNTVKDIFQQNIVQYIADNGPIETTADVDALVNWILAIRAKDNDVRTVLFDSTSPVVGFPATLPQLGIADLVEPSVSYDTILGRILMKHHDGHLSTLTTDGLDFRNSILGDLTTLQIKRRDGTYTPAIKSFSYMQPLTALEGELWVKPDATMHIWDGGWKVINLADTLNSVIFNIETRLYNGISDQARKYDFTTVADEPEFKNQLQRELHTYAAINGYDPLGADYVASDAFTWNYSQATNFAPVDTTTVPARWHNALTAHQRTVTGVLETERPNFQPWKLFGVADSTTWWNGLSGSIRNSYTPKYLLADIDSTFHNGGSVKAVSVSHIAALVGALATVETVSVVPGDLVLLTAQDNPTENGVWEVNMFAWTRPTVFQYLAKKFVTATAGPYRNTVWVNEVETEVGQPIYFDQARVWSNKLWADIKALHPTLKLSVDTINDTLLPPYVSSGNAMAANALTNSIPTGTSAGYSFGESSPVEEVWKKSLEYKYSLARALFRFDPLAFLGFCWGFNWVRVDGILYDGLDMQMPGHKRFRLHGEEVNLIARQPLTVTGTGLPIILTYDAYDEDRRQSFTVRRNGTKIGIARVGLTSVVGGYTITLKDEGRPFRIGDRFEVSPTGSIFVPSATNKILGFGQIFTNALRETSIDTESSYAISAFREWDVNMGYRAGGLVATDDLTVFTDNETLSASSFRLLFKRNQIAKNEWAQGLRISVLRFGAHTETEFGNVAAGTGSDWVFRVEGYNPRYLDISYFTLGGETVTFNALSSRKTELPWLQPTKILGTSNTRLPFTITGIQNVVDFLFGYQKYLESRGWEFNNRSEFNVDAETGRVRNFQLEIEKFVDRMYAGISLGEGHVINPFIDRAWFRQDTGLLSEFVDSSLFDVTGHPGVFDTLGIKYKKEDLDIIRTNAKSSFGATGPMFSAHVQIDEFEHIFIFNNFAEQSTQSGTLYDPFSGGKAATYKFKGRKQASQTMRPEFGGHFLVGNEVKQNLQASTDNVANFYDANLAFENETTTRHSLALLGFNSKGYFDSLDISNKTQFNFWRGLVQSKGTNISVSAYLNNNRFDDARIDEFWAYKVAEYGDARQKTYPELKLNVNDAVTQFTQLQFDTIPFATGSATPILNGFSQINRFDESRWFSIDDLDQDAFFKAEIVGTYVLTNPVANNVYKLPFTADFLAPSSSYAQQNATTIVATTSTGPITVIGYGPAKPRFNPVKLFNYVDDELVEEIPIWNPAVGVHTPTAMEAINIISNKDPSSYDPLRPWGTNEVGRVWFNTTNLAYLPYYDYVIFPNLEERLSRWGTLADYSTVDVFEWIQSTVPPEDYRALVLEQAGDASVDPLYKATGEVAQQDTSTRTRNWFMRPIAWSYSPVPSNVDWGATPPFPGGSTDAGLTIEGGTASLSKGTFEGYNIVPGMRIGAWNNDPFNPVPLSEYIIEDQVAKKLKNTSGAEFSPITVTSTGGTTTPGDGGTVNPGTGSATPVTKGFNVQGLTYEMTDIPDSSTFANTMTILKSFGSGVPVFGGGPTIPATTITLTKGTHFTVSNRLITFNSISPTGLDISGGYAQIVVTPPATGSFVFTLSSTTSLAGIPTNANIASSFTLTKSVYTGGFVVGGGVAGPNAYTDYTFILTKDTHYTQQGTNITLINNYVNEVNVVGGKGVINYSLTAAAETPTTPTTPTPGTGNAVTVAGGIPSKVSVEVSSYKDVSGQIVFTKVQDVMVPLSYDTDGAPISWRVEPTFKATESGGGDSEQIIVNSALSTDQGTPPVPAVAAVSATGGSVLIRMGGAPSASQATGFPKTTYRAIVKIQDPAFPDDPTKQIDGPKEVDVAARNYSMTVSVDGSQRSISVNGDKAQTLGELVTEMNLDMSGSSPWYVASDGIRGRSPTIGAASSVNVISGGDLLPNLQGFDVVTDAVQGKSAVAAQAAIPRQLPTSYLYGAKVVVVTGDIITVEMPKFGLTIKVQVTTGGTYAADAIRNTIVGALSNIVQINDAIVITPIIAGSNFDLSNILDDADNKPGWRAWNVPTQEELDSDGVPPFSSWKPYVGDFVPVPGTLAQIREATEYSKAPLTLKSGRIIDRFNTTWTKYRLIQDRRLFYPKISEDTSYTVSKSSDNVVTFTTFENVDPIATTVYLNGIAQLKSNFTIDGKIVTVSNVASEDEVTVVVRKYEPTAAEIAFDPDVADDFTYQQQFKLNYNYVSQPVRDNEGALSSTIYYYWVKNKTTQVAGKRMSIQTITQELIEGPPNYLTFQNFREAQTYMGVAYPRRYDAVTISGLSYIVTKDDTFKLRFTRNFTLRDDSEDLNLKNTHAEWSLMRPGQRTRIAEKLWQKLADSVVGADAAGNEIPAARRALYDERNGTRTSYGFGPEQTLGPAGMLRLSIADAILNTRLTVAAQDGSIVPDYITFLDLDESDSWFATNAAARQTMTDIWNMAKTEQVNEIFFAALNDVLEKNYELTDIFKTSRLSAYSIKVVHESPVAQVFE